ncbi:hypothetical protein E2C01_041988 [Portunus trituberculatus]|uniref:Uncharacterized protein n=1 Tax=Portunus trituberculatus TaxID=210409 RepID=A0A5B7FLB6_PORTR|nr:hypothetical protein [Portunus trituberculatus]
MTATILCNPCSVCKDPFKLTPAVVQPWTRERRGRWAQGSGPHDASSRLKQCQTQAAAGQVRLSCPTTTTSSPPPLTGR